MSANVIRAVLVRRPTDYELLLATHATRGQAEFFLSSRGQSIDTVEREHEVVNKAIAAVLGAIPSRWRRAGIDRSELGRFLFEPDDVVIAVGQDGLVANVAKYLTGQLVIGVNPLPERYDGPLARHTPVNAAGLMASIEARRVVEVHERTMVRATLDDGQKLLALNEVFIGHRSHQSARYDIRLADKNERQSSSGIIACTGTGATGWGCSIHRAYGSPLPLLKPADPSICFFVREAWLSKATGTSLTFGRCEQQEPLVVRSEMNQGGVIFGDGIEDDYLTFDWGKVAEVRVADQRLRLAV